MVSSKAANDPETLAFEATVERGGSEVVLSETYFYPTGGGQPADRGQIGGYDVLDVWSDGEQVVHRLDSEIESGTTVLGGVDANFRRYCMRAHTASHVLYGAGRRLFADLGYGGFDIGLEKVRVDFTTSTAIDDDLLVELEGLVNRCVWESRDVTWEQLPREEALSRDDVAFNTKTEEGITGETVRIVEVDGWDVAACGGTHVSNTCQIGPITVLDRSNPGEGMTRVEFAVGPEGIDRRATEKRAALDAAAELGTNVDGLAEETARVRADRDALREELDSLRTERLESRVSSIADDPFERDGYRWAVGIVEADTDRLTEAVRDRPDEIDVLVLTTASGQLAISSGPIDVRGIIDELTAEFGGGGGGSTDVGQAGGLQADGETVAKYLERTDV